MSDPQPSPVMPEAEYLKTLSLLYVEDDEEIRDQLAQILKRRVGRLYTAGNGMEGLELYHRHAPDMIITDILMPVMDGLAMASAIRETDHVTPIIVTTAFERADYLIRSIDIGIDKYVVKPVRREQLVDALHKCADSLRSAALLRESEERYRTMFHSFHVGICIVSPAWADQGDVLLGGRVRDCNDAFLRMIGHASVEELRQRRYGDLVAAHQHDGIRESCRQQLLPLGFLEESEREFVHADGSRLPTLVQSILRRDVNNNPCELWELVSDNAEKKRASEQLQLAARAFENSGEGIIITDSDCRIVSVNAAFTRITGYAAADVLGRTPAILSSGHDHPVLYEQMWSAIHQCGYWQGELWNRHQSGKIYPEWLSITAILGPDGKASHYVGIFTDITERKRAEEHIRFLAQHDALTGLPNRVVLQNRLEHALACAARERKQVAVMFLDLDNFKTINDSLGHQFGDLLLREVSQRLQKQVRASDTICRQGGDEFLIVLNGINDRDDAALIAQKLQDTLATPLTVSERNLSTSGSIGIAVFPDDGVDADTLIKNADLAMYQAKRAGRAGYRFFARNMDDDSPERRELERRLRAMAAEPAFES